MLNRARDDDEPDISAGLGACSLKQAWVGRSKRESELFDLLLKEHAMARKDVALRKADTILTELDRLNTEISRRAYDLFRKRGSLLGGPLADWLNAERQLVWKPAIELRRKDSQFEVLAATPGVDAKELDVQITPEDVLIKADIHHRHTPEEGAVQVCEFNGGQLFRSVHFPERIDPNTAMAEYRDGMLRLTASIAKPKAHKVEITAA
jgi:HSP20 family protein